MMRMNSTYRFWGLLLATSLCLGSCSSVRNVAEEKLNTVPPKLDFLEIDSHFSSYPLARVAILPFENLTRCESAADVMRQSFGRHFSSKRYQDVEPYQVNAMVIGSGSV